MHSIWTSHLVPVPTLCLEKMSSGVRLVPAELASLVLETLLTGICLVLASTAIYVLVFKRGVTQGSYAPAAQFNRVLFGVTVALTCSVLAVRIHPMKPPSSIVMYIFAALACERVSSV